MNHSAMDREASRSATNTAGTAPLYILRGVVAVIFLLVALGITTAEWQASDGNAAPVSTAQQQ